MEVAIRFRRKTGNDFLMFSRSQVFGNDLSDEIKGLGFGEVFAVVRHVGTLFYLIKKMIRCSGRGLPELYGFMIVCG
jgi:hypothetical protein